MKPKISVITSVLDESVSLPATLRSVASQDCNTAFEHIIVDGGSTDGSIDLAKRYASESPYPVRIVSRVPRGIYDAINCGISVAEGEYICVLHANDSYSDSGVLSRVCAAAGSGTDVVYGDAEYIPQHGLRGRYYSARRFTPSALLEGFAPPHPSMFIARKIFDEIGDYDQSFPIAGDFEFDIRLFLRRGADSVYIPGALTRLTPGGVSASWSNRLIANNREKMRALRKNGYRICPLRLLLRYFRLFDR